MSERKQRYYFIDLVRFAAVLFMIQGHVFDALLSHTVKSLPFFYLHDFFHGFVAPTFFFSSGVAFGISTIRRWDEQLFWGKVTQARIVRFVFLIAVGYVLHLPYFSLTKIWNEASTAEIHALLQSDALQCVGVTLLLLQITVWLVKRKEVFVQIVALAAIAVVFLSPLLWGAKFSGYLPTALVSYLNAENASWFPLFPWAAYILCGVILGEAFARTQQPQQAVTLMWKLIGFSIASILLSWLVTRLPFELYPEHDFWKANPTMFFIRLGAVSIFTGLIFLLEQRIPDMPRLPLIVGRQSFFIYILHLVIVYGSVLNRGLSQWIGPTLSLAQSLGMFALVFAAVSAIALLWYRWNSTNAELASYVVWAAAFLFVLEFVIRPY